MTPLDAAAQPAAADADALIADLGARARVAARRLAQATTAEKTTALRAAAAHLRATTDAVLAANAKDVAAAKAADKPAAFIDRLTLDAGRVAGFAAGLEQVADLPDPVGRELARWTRPNGLDIARVATPLGVIGVIFEARPGVAADAAGLCAMAGNAAILRAGSDSRLSAAAIVDAVRAGFAEAGLPEDAAQIVPTPDRAAVGAMLRADGVIDVIVPRGGRSLVERVRTDARVPVFSHLDGVNHIYVHADADPAIVDAVIVNAKLRRPGICGAVECLLFDRAAEDRARAAVAALLDAGCAVRGDAGVQGFDARVEAATDADWGQEYLDAVVAARMVDGYDDAAAHIARYGSGHTEAILTRDDAVAERFLGETDAAIVMRDASTQFADGGEFGMGAEIGIATGRMHARGPVGAAQLTSFKYVVRGAGQTRP